MGFYMRLSLLSMLFTSLSFPFHACQPSSWFLGFLFQYLSSLDLPSAMDFWVAIQATPTYKGIVTFLGWSLPWTPYQSREVGRNIAFVISDCLELFQLFN